MEACIVGKKIGMTSLYDEAGRLIPVTVVQAEPCVVSQRKSVASDGYSAVQVAAEPAKLRSAKANSKESKNLKRHGLNRPEAGHLAKAKVAPHKRLVEFRVADDEEIALGHQLTVTQFNAGDLLKVTGTSKGKGFAGAVKRWHFHGADMTHGSMIHRKPQSGGATDPAHTFKGSRRPGRMGGDTVSIRSAKVFKVDADRSLLLIKGPVPGAIGGTLTIVRLKAAPAAEAAKQEAK